jgi:hypothetical protein
VALKALLDRVRPHPHRGDVIAAGAVPLAVATFVIELRMTQWPLGPRFAVVALVAGLLLLMGWLAPLEGEAPRSYHSVLLVAGLLPTALALVLLAEALGASRPPGSGGLFWAFAVEALIAAAAARHARSAVCTLIAALAGILAVGELVSWAFKPHGLGTFRAVLLALALAFLAGSVRLRERNRAHAVQLANASGISVLLIGLTFALRPLLGFAFFGGSPGSSHIAFGWECFLLAAGFGLVAYAGVDHERGPAYVGLAVLATFALLVGLTGPQHRSLVGWPLFLLAIGAAGLVIGLRPRRPLPPSPEQGSGAVTPTVPLRRNHDSD